MHSRIQKWGNSLALRIPKVLAERAGIRQGSQVNLHIVDDVIQIDPILPDEYSLESLLAKVTDENIHQEVDTGTPQGNELL